MAVRASPRSPRGLTAAGRRRLRARRWRARARGGVSEVVATILLLALTVTLFAAIFAFVTRFPAPPAQNVNEFEAALVQGPSGITELKILQTSGPTLSGSDAIFLQSSSPVSNWQFTRSTGVPVAWGTGNSSTGWSAGQYWTTTFSPVLPIGTNLTVYITTPGALLFEGVVPGYSESNPPLLTSTYTVPATPNVNASFKIYAQVVGNISGLKLNVSLSGIPGLSGVQTMAASGTSGLWVYNTTSGATTAGSYEAFILGASTTTLATVSGSVAVTISGVISGGGGGGGSSSALSVSVAISPSPPAEPGLGTSMTFSATISYSGTLSEPFTLTFSVVQSRPASGVGYWPASDFVKSWEVNGTISGPSTETVYSSQTFSGWLLNTPTPDSPVIYANVSVTGVGTASGSTTDGTLASPLWNGFAYFTKMDSTTTSTSVANIETSFNACGGHSGNCPYLYLSFWNNYTSSVTISGTVWTNSSTGASDTSYTIKSDTVASGGTYTVNVVSAGTTDTWTLPTGGGTGDYYVRTWLTVTSGGVAVGYLYATFTGDYT
jgi:hypothetical protein